MDLSGDTDIIGFSFDNYMGIDSRYVYVFFIRYTKKWEEVQKLTPADAESGAWFGVTVALYNYTAIIWAQYYNERGDDNVSGYMYTKISRKWNNSDKIVPEHGAAYDKFGYSVSLSVSTALFVSIYAE